VNNAISRGLELHRSGKIAEAQAHYRIAAAAEPRNPEAHHLLGVTFHQLGDCSTALVHLDRAVGLNPDASHMHSNRGETLRALGRLDESEKACRRALALDPGNASAHHNLGTALLRLRRYSEAAASLDEAVRIYPRAQSLAGFGDALRHLGRFREAIQKYESATAADPTLVAARGNLAVLYEQSGRYEEALQHAEAAVSIAPRNVTAHLHLGRLLLELGRNNDAMEAFAAGLEIDPDNAELCLRNGQAWHRLGRFGEAIRWAERAHRLDPSLIEAKCLAAHVHLEAGDPETATRAFRAILDERPDCREAELGLAKSLMEEGDVAASTAQYRAAVGRTPQAAGVHAALGHALMNAGDLDGAVTAFRFAIELNGRCVPAFAGLATTLRGKTDDETVATIERMLEAPWMIDAKRASLRFSLAQVFDGKGDYQRAGDELKVANALQKAEFAERDRAYEPADHRSYADRLCKAFNSEYFARMKGAGDPSTRPVFIVGMPRSGTTLTEQIIASHPQAFGAGERRFAQLSFHRATRGNGVDSALDGLASMTRDMVDRAASWHLEQLRRLDGGLRLRVVDKMPDNYQHLGWIATAFPNAKIIHCRRDVRDTAFSCWMTNFSRIPWANDLEHLAERINEYRRIMDHFRRVLPVQILEVDYEETVADQVGATRRLLEWVGLPWDEACLDFHKTERLVRTASVAQVRQPIYSRSVARWKRYEAHLKPLLDRLEPLD
jgi:tetratricopeptide (TPR) repeat protein